MEDINIFYRSLINAKQANEGTKGQLAFDLNYFRRKPKVVDILTKQAKQFMKTLPNYRTDDEIDVIVRGMSALDEFSYYTTPVQREIARHLFYEEYGPNRTIFKRENNADFMYFVVKGSLFYRGDDGTYLISKGEKIGENDIMSGARRIGTLQTQSDEVQLASIHKESYQEIIYNQNKIGSGLHGIVSKSALLSRWPMRLLPENPSLWLIRNYKADSWISEDLWTDDWVYVVKSGTCIIAKAIDELEMHRSGMKSQLRRKRRDHLLDELTDRRKSTNRKAGQFQHSDWEGTYRPLKSRGMARPDYVNSRQEQYKLDQQLMRELRTGKDYETKWFTVSEIGIGDVAAPVTLVPSDEVKHQLALVTPHGAEILQIEKRLFVENITQDFKSLLSVMNQIYPSYRDIKKSQDEHIQWQMYKSAMLGGLMSLPRDREMTLTSTAHF